MLDEKITVEEQLDAESTSIEKDDKDFGKSFPPFPSEKEYLSQTSVTPVTSQHLGGSTELTVLMPLKTALVDTLDTMTYATRLRHVLKVFNTIGKVGDEERHTRPISGAVERLRTVNSFRWSILNSDTQLLLGVTFDTAWETYIRKIANVAGPLLDVILCHCEGYENFSTEKGCAQFAKWVRKYQVPCDFFYSATADLTVDDLQYLKSLERLQRTSENPAAFDRDATRLRAKSPRAKAAEIMKQDPAAIVRQGLRMLMVLHSLKEKFPEEDHARYLQCAAEASLLDFIDFVAKTDMRDRLPGGASVDAAFEWLVGSADSDAPPAAEQLRGKNGIQGNILTGYRGHTHGCLALVQVVDSKKAREFVRSLRVTTQADAESDPPPKITRNVAFTPQGLSRLGVPKSELEKLPREFVESMAARAGLLGDVRGNHPANWQLPERAAPGPVGPEVAPVRMSTVDLVLHLETAADPSPGDHRWSPSHPLHRELCDLLDGDNGVELLAVQPLRRFIDPESRQVRGHFGFLDGISQPVHTRGLERDRLPLGEFLLGYRNDRDKVAVEPEPDPLLDDGTFLVVRKLIQHVDRFNHILSSHANQIPPEQTKARLMGRFADGTPLIPLKPGAEPNDFDYENDPHGDQCPLQSHIRRTNPRSKRQPGEIPEPRIVRRGFPFGPAPVDSSKETRGLVFMAYNASIAEQFEVIQRWATGGNSTGVSSVHNDPFLGVPRKGENRVSRFMYDGKIRRVELGSEPLVSLAWGMYLFVPSIKALGLIADGFPTMVDEGLVERGNKLIKQLQALEWKKLLEDRSAKRSGVTDAVWAAIREQLQESSAPALEWKKLLEDRSAKRSGATDAVWAAIRETHGGALHTPYGLLLGSLSAVRSAFRDSQTYSVRKYWDRMDKTLGQGFLGMDPDPVSIGGTAGEDARDLDQRYLAAVPKGRYEAESRRANTAIGAVGERAAFDKARELTARWLAEKVADVPAGAGVTISLREMMADILAGLASNWFGIPERGAPETGRELVRGLVAVASYIFSPNPEKVVADEAAKFGEKIRQLVGAYVARRDARDVVHGTISGKLFSQIKDDDQLARTLGGIVQGFTAPTAGTFLSVIHALTQSEALWRLQQAMQRDGGDRCAVWNVAHEVIRPEVVEAMQRNPVPSLLHRTAVSKAKIAGVDVKPGQHVVLGVRSATREQPCQTEVLFGGNYGTGEAPVHACPGQKMAMGVLVGMICALVEAGTLTPAGQPLTLRVG